MASLPANDPAAPDVVGEVLLLPISQIEMGERLRPVDPVWAETLGRIMLAEGQTTPIEVCKLPGQLRWTLVTGGHRYVGAGYAGMTSIRAIQVGVDKADRRMREISENLWRKGLEPIDRAAFIAEMHQLLKARLGIAPDASAQSIAAQARWKNQLKEDASDASATIADAYGIDAQVGEQLGLSERTIRNDLLLHRGIPASLIEKLRGHPVASNATQLRTLAKLDERKQREIVGLLLDGTVKSVGEGLALLDQRPKPAAEDKRLSAFLGSFARMTLSEKKGALSQIEPQLPKGYQFGGNADELPAAADKALREARLVIAFLMEGSAEVTPAMLQSAYDSCEAALNGREPAVLPDAADGYTSELLEAISGAREQIDGLIEDDVICDGPSAIVDYERTDMLRKAGGRLQLAAMPFYFGGIRTGGRR